MKDEVCASVVVRTKNSGATLDATIDSLRGQTVAVEIVVVDSGSTDDTLDMARERADRVVEIPPATFSYGRALNVGAAAALSPVHVALSSHCVLPRNDWVEIAAAHVHRGAGAVVGLNEDASGAALTGPRSFDHAYLRQHWYWGFSNHASAWSAGVWRSHPFDEQLPANEDKEWSWRITATGAHLVGDPALAVPIGHRRAAGGRAYYRRLANEVGAYRHLGVLPAFGVTDAWREWSSREGTDPFVTRSRRLGRTRAIEVAARWTAGRGRSS